MIRKVNGSQKFENWKQIKSKIFENLEDWKKTYIDEWLAHFERFGDINWKIYQRPQNHTPVAGAGIDLSTSRLMLISSAGAYQPEMQQPFDAPNPLGDYGIRVFSPDTPFINLAYAHDHYDQKAVKKDPQVLLPLAHLREMVIDGKIGTLTKVVSFMGYQPDVSRVIDETILAILGIAEKEKIDAALLVPA